MRSPLQGRREARVYARRSPPRAAPRYAFRPPGLRYSGCRDRPRSRESRRGRSGPRSVNQHGEYRGPPFRSRRTAHRTDRPRARARRRHHPRVHRGERVLRPQDRPHRRDLDSGRGDLDGVAARLQGFDDPGKQHRADRRLGGGHAVGDVLRAAGPADDRLVERVSVLDLVRDLRARRRALVTGSDLPFPEGVACAEVLKVGSPGAGVTHAGVEASRAGLLAVIWGAIVSAAFAVIVATRIFASDIVRNFRFGGDRGPVSGFDFSLSFALFAVGHLVGLWVGVAMGVGALIAWVWGVPHYSALAGSAGDAAEVARQIWSTKIRFVGAGTIGVAAIWTLLKLVRPVASGLKSAFAAAHARKTGQGALLPRTEQDIPVGTVGLVMLVCFVPIAWLLGHFAGASGLGEHLWALAIGGLVYCVLMGFFVSAVTGYMAGLIGASNSPLSGVGILVVIGAALLLVVGIKPYVPAELTKALVAYALLVTSVVFAVATIANNNLQDLKTGQLVDATPAKQQWALVIGVIAGAAIIPPILEILSQAYGFVGAAGAHEHPL